MNLSNLLLVCPASVERRQLGHILEHPNSFYFSQRLSCLVSEPWAAEEKVLTQAWSPQKYLGRVP